MAAEFWAMRLWGDLCVETKMWDLTIRIKKNDEVGGKLLQALIIDCLVKAGIEGAPVWTDVNGLVNVENLLCILKAFP